MITAKYGIPSASPGAMFREEMASGTELGIAADQLLPVIVSNFVAHVSEQRSIGLVNGLSLPLAFHVIRLRDINSDDAIGMAGEDSAFVRRAELEFERKAVLRILHAILQRKRELH